MPSQLGLYLHVPFCLSKCRYCDFYSIDRHQKVPNEYVQSLLREYSRLQGRSPNTIYFGGGTPSLMTAAQVSLLIDRAAPISDAEITLEANPETVTLESLKDFYSAGVNRISFGVQSARDAQLARLGRSHNSLQSIHALEWARIAGFTNINGDIMMALPYYTHAEFDDTLSLLEENCVTHISAYLLKIEAGTPFGRCIPEGLPSEEQCAEFYLSAVDKLKRKGYQQYEISNFAIPGFQSKHNLLYWDCQDYLGLGPGAHSCIQNKRFHWPRNITEYICGCSPVFDGICNEEDYIIMRLRLCDGLHLDDWHRRYGGSLSERQNKLIAQCQAAGYVHYDGANISLSPTGMIIQNSILAELI